MLGIVYTKNLLLRACLLSPSTFLNSWNLKSSRLFSSTLSADPSPAPSVYTEKDRAESKDASFEVSYLINSCGLSSDAAIRVNKRINLKSTEKADAVLNFFKSYGFSDFQIARIVKILPKVLKANPEKTFKPKLELLVSLGAPPETVTKIIQNYPGWLYRSLDKVVVPHLEFLKSVVHSNDTVLRIFLRWNFRMHFDLENALSPNVADLRELGMGERAISELLLCQPNLLTGKSARLKNTVDRVREMGFDPKDWTFACAMASLHSIRKETWERKCREFRKLGWSEAELLNVVHKNPKLMTKSKEKVCQVIDFLMNEMGFTPSSIAECPWVFNRKMENIVARFYVIKRLIAEGVIEKGRYTISSVIIPSETVFIEKYVTRHASVLPKLFDLYSQFKKDGKPFAAVHKMVNA